MPARPWGHRRRNRPTPQAVTPSPVARLAAVVAGCGAAQGTDGVGAVLAWLHTEADARRVWWLPAPDSISVAPAASWPPGGGARSRPAVERAHPVVDVDVDDGATHRGALRLQPHEELVTGKRERRLAEAAAFLVIVLREVQLSQAHSTWAGRERAARTELASARPMLAAVKAAERRRLATAVLAGVQAPVGHVMLAVEQLRLAVEAGSQVTDAATAVRGRVEDLLRQVRRLARGTYCTALSADGVAAALAQTAEDLDHPRHAHR